MRFEKGAIKWEIIDLWSYKQLELEYETEENARDAFMDIVGAYESVKIDVYI